MSLALSGIFSGIDTDVLISASMAAARRPLGRYATRKNSWQSKLSAVEEIERRMDQLKALVDDLRDTDNLRHVSAVSSNTDVVLISASTGATEGVHDVIVDSLALSEKEIHVGVTPTEAWTNSLGVTDGDTEYISAADISDATGTDYKFVFQFGSESQVVVDLSSYDATGITLNQLISEINTAAGYTAASAVSSSGSYKLRIQASSVGDNALTITEDDSISVLDSTDDFTQSVDGATGADTLIGAGQFVYTYNGVSRTITTTASSNLGGLRDLINNDASNPGVTASILEYEADASHKYHLVLSGNDSGSDYAITIEASTTLSGFTPGANWTQTQAAQDARFRVDGYPADPNWIERSSNSVSDVIDGVTLTLLDAGTVTVNLNRDTSRLKSDLENLVGVYNGLADTIDSSSGYDSATDTAGVLIGDSGLKTLLYSIRSSLTGSLSGFENGLDSYTLPSQIGIEIDRDGQMSIDYTVLDEALSDDYAAVLAAIGAVGTGGSDTSYIQFNSAESGTTAGTYDVEVDFDAAGTVIAARIRSEGESTWRDATVDGNVITGGSGNPEQYLEMTAIWDNSQSGTPYTQSGQVRVRQGFAGKLYDKLDAMLDVTDGTMTIKKDRYNDAIDQLDKRIEAQQSRLEAKEKRLRAKYARLEAALARLDSLRGSFDALLTQLNATNNG